MVRGWKIVCSFALAGCAFDTADAAPAPVVAAATAALSATKDELAPLDWSPFQITGRDAGYSARFGKVSAWVFGDTFNGIPTADGSILSNTWSWTTDTSANDGIGPFKQATDASGAPQPLLPYDPAGYENAYNALHRCPDEDCKCAAGTECGDRFALWPGPVVAYTDNARAERALVLYTELFVGKGDYNYRVRGTSIARWNDPRKHADRTGTAIFGPDDPNMNAGAIKYTAAGVEYLYVYSCVPNSELRADCRVGRAPFLRGSGVDALGAILDRSRWRFFAGGDPDSDSSWDASPSAAVVVLTAATTLSVQANAYLGSLTVSYAQFLTNDVYLQTAPRPEGPWSGPPSAPLINVQLGDVADYYPILHPEFDARRGQRVYLTTAHPGPPKQLIMPMRLFAVTLQR